MDIARCAFGKDGLAYGQYQGDVLLQSPRNGLVYKSNWDENFSKTILEYT